MPPNGKIYGNGYTKRRNAARLVSLVAAYAREHIGDDLHETTITLRFQTSASTLRSAFKLACGASYRSYIEGIRMAHAKELLDTERLRVKEAMHRCGYKNRATFRRVFRKHFGCNPSDYP